MIYIFSNDVYLTSFSLQFVLFIGRAERFHTKYFEITIEFYISRNFRLALFMYSNIYQKLLSYNFVEGKVANKTNQFREDGGRCSTPTTFDEFKYYTHPSQFTFIAQQVRVY